MDGGDIVHGLGFPCFNQTVPCLSWLANRNWFEAPLVASVLLQLMQGCKMNSRRWLKCIWCLEKSHVWLSWFKLVFYQLIPALSNWMHWLRSDFSLGGLKFASSKRSQTLPGPVSTLTLAEMSQSSFNSPFHNPFVPVWNICWRNQVCKFKARPKVCSCQCHP